MVSNTRREEEVDLWATLYLVLYYKHYVSIHALHFDWAHVCNYSLHLSVCYVIE